AIAELKSIEADDPNHPAIALWRARLNCEAKRWPDARVIVEAVLKKEPTLPFAVMVLAEVQIGEGTLDAAKATIEKVIEAMPDARTPRFMLGVALMQAKRAPEAVEVLQPAHDADWEDFEVAMPLATSLLDANRPDDAILVARRAVTVNDGSAQ